MTAKIVHIISNQPHESNMLLQEKRKKNHESMSNESMSHH